MGRMFDTLGLGLGLLYTTVHYIGLAPVSIFVLAVAFAAPLKHVQYCEACITQYSHSAPRQQPQTYNQIHRELSCASRGTAEITFTFFSSHYIITFSSTAIFPRDMLNEHYTRL